MQYKSLGKTGVKVSSLCLGTMTFCDGANEATSGEIFSRAREAGINFFDCADVYADGNSEKVLGKFIKKQRDKVLISTKAYYPMSEDINAGGTSRLHLTHTVHNSLRNLDTDYIDVFFLHCFDPETPLEESLATLDMFIQQGKILYVGLSNFAAWQMMKAKNISDQMSNLTIACIQPMYNLLKRQCEVEILPMAASEGLAVFPYSPLAGGMLTGKYIDKNLKDGRFKESEMYQQRYEAQQNANSVKLFCKYAEENNLNPASLAIAWAASHPYITAPLIGARTVEQLEIALASLDIDMSQERRDIISGFSMAPALPTDREEERAS